MESLTERFADASASMPYVKSLPLILQMRLLSSNRDVQMKGCALLSNYGWNDPASKEPLMYLGGVDAATAALGRFLHDVEVESSCLNALAALSLYNRKVSLRVGELGVVDMTAEFWRRNFQNPKMVVANYFGCYQDFSPENRARMREVGAIKLILEACGEGGRHFNDAAAQFSCWCGFSSFHSEDNHMLFRRLGGSRHLYVVFRDHAKSYRVREEVLQATKGLCAWRAIREDLAKEGFVELLTSALKEEKGDPQVQALGMETLRMFVESNATLRSSLIANGGMDIAFSALATHAGKLLNTRDSWDMQNVYGDLNDHQYNVPGAAADLLYSLALDSEESRQAMVSVGAIQKLKLAIQATERRIEAVRLRTWLGACQTLHQLKQAAKTAGLEAARERVMQEHSCPHESQPLKVITSDVPFQP